MLSAACRMTARPTAVLPVKDSLAISGWSTSAAPASCPVPGTRLTTPAGMPAACRMRISSISASGVSSDGLSTAVQPAARAGANFHEVVTMGKFHGTIRPTTPTGSSTARAVKAASGRSTGVPASPGAVSQSEP